MNSLIFSKNKFLLSIIIFSICFLGVFIFLIWPAWLEINSINKKISEEKIRLEKLYNTDQLSKKINDNYDKIKNDIGFLDDFILKENQELQYITALEQIAAEENVNLKINIGETKANPGQKFSTLNLSFELAGEWPNILRWISRLESIPYYTNIKEIAITTHEQKNEATTVAMATISAETFWLLPKK